MSETPTSEPDGTEELEELLRRVESLLEGIKNLPPVMREGFKARIQGAKTIAALRQVITELEKKGGIPPEPKRQPQRYRPRPPIPTGLSRWAAHEEFWASGLRY